MSEPSATTTFEAPDAAAKASQAAADYQASTTDLLGEKMVLNMGPSHPATHGVLRLILEIDGEMVERAEPDIGFLHRGDEKIAENMHYNQFVPYTDRLDYLAPLANNVAYAMAVEKLAQHYGRSPSLLSEQELRDYFIYLVEKKRAASSTLRLHIFAAKFLFTKTLQKP